MRKLTLLTALIVAMPGLALAGDPPPSAPTCKSPMAPGDETYAFRDVRLFVRPGEKYLRVQFCVATDDKRGIWDSAFRISVFKTNGAYAASMPAGPISYPVRPISNPPPGTPANMIPMDGAVAMEPAAVGGLQAMALIQGKIVPCKEGPGGACKNGADTGVDFNFLLPVPPIETARRGGRN